MEIGIGLHVCTYAAMHALLLQPPILLLLLLMLLLLLLLMLLLLLLWFCYCQKVREVLVHLCFTDGNGTGVHMRTVVIRRRPVLSTPLDVDV